VEKAELGYGEVEWLRRERWQYLNLALLSPNGAVRAIEMLHRPIPSHPSLSYFITLQTCSNKTPAARSGSACTTHWSACYDAIMGTLEHTKWLCILKQRKCRHRGRRSPFAVIPSFSTPLRLLTMLITSTKPTFPERPALASNVE